MNSNENQKLENQEIDITIVAGKIRNVVRGFKMSIYNFIRFCIQKKIIIGALFVIGIGVGLFFDKVTKTYESKLIVVPNYKSYDYLYSKIDLIQSKIEDKDTSFLKKIGIKNPESLRKIKVKPIIDIYQYISIAPDKNFELLKLIAEDGQMSKIMEDEVTSKNYTYHLIEFTTDKKCSDREIIEPLLEYFNHDQYFNELRVVYNKNKVDKIKADELIISQIDNFLNGLTTDISKNNKSNNLVYYNENTQLNDVLKTKDALVEEIGRLKVDLVSSDKVVKKISSTTNIRNTEAVNGKLKFVLPLLLILIYFLGYGIVQFYKTQSKLSQNN